MELVCLATSEATQRLTGKRSFLACRRAIAAICSGRYSVIFWILYPVFHSMAAGQGARSRSLPAGNSLPPGKRADCIRFLYWAPKGSVRLP